MRFGQDRYITLPEIEIKADPNDTRTDKDITNGDDRPDEKKGKGGLLLLLAAGAGAYYLMR